MAIACAEPSRAADLVLSGPLQPLGRPYTAADTVHVTYSPGGSGAAAMGLAKARRMIVDGYCASACAWAFAANPRACITPRGSLVFHGAHDPGTGAPMPAATEWWLARSDKRLRPVVAPAVRRGFMVSLGAKDVPWRACR